MMASLQERTVEILKAVDEMFRRLENWINQPNYEPVIPREVELGMRRAEDVCRAGDIPSRMVDLATVCVPALVSQFEGYNRHESGKVQPSGAPGPQFWAAAKRAKTARFNAEAASVIVREPVHSLRAQGVSDTQIAGAIYGYRGAGPFMTEDGVPNVRLLDQEAKDPGSVWSPDFIPPWEMAGVKARQKAFQDQIAIYDRLQDGQQVYDDPASVEEMLRDGCFIQQIERAKRVSREEVLRVAQSIGVNAVDGPGYAPSAMQVPQDADFDDDEDDENDDDLDEDSNEPVSQKSTDDVRAEAIRLFELSGGTRKSADIAIEMRKSGYPVNTGSVAAFLAHHRRSAETTAT